MIDIQEFSAPVAAEMQECRRQYDALLHHENAYLHEILAFVAEYKGKMLRPLLTLLCGKLVGRVTPATLSTALAIELFHTASLLHDDIVDESDERRAGRSVNAAFGNKSAVLVGDYLLATALLCVARTQDARLTTLLSVCAQQMTDGELLQLRNAQLMNNNSSEEDYFRVIERKTAALFAVCAESAALCGGADEEECARLRTFGLNVGICFQLKDDILDYVGTPALGKPTGKDLMEGKVTLPLLYALRQGGAGEVEHLLSRVKSAELTREEAAQLIDFACRHGGILYAREVMNRYALQAKEAIAPFFGSDSHTALVRFVDYVVSRIR